MDMTPGSKHNDEHDEAQKKVFRGYGFRPGGKNMKKTVSNYYVSLVTSETSSDYPGIRWRLQSEHVQLCNRTSQATGEPKHSPRPEAGNPGGVVKDGCWLFQTSRP